MLDDHPVLEHADLGVLVGLPDQHGALDRLAPSQKLGLGQDRRAAAPGRTALAAALALGLHAGGALDAGDFVVGAPGAAGLSHPDHHVGRVVVGPGGVLTAAATTATAARRAAGFGGLARFTLAGGLTLGLAGVPLVVGVLAIAFDAVGAGPATAATTTPPAATTPWVVLVGGIVGAVLVIGGILIGRIVVGGVVLAVGAVVLEVVRSLGLVIDRTFGCRLGVAGGLGPHPELGERDGELGDFALRIRGLSVGVLTADHGGKFVQRLSGLGLVDLGATSATARAAELGQGFFDRIRRLGRLLGLVLRLRGRFTRARFRLGRFGLGTATTTPGLDRGGQLIQGGQLIEAERHLLRNRFVGGRHRLDHHGGGSGTGSATPTRCRGLGFERERDVVGLRHALIGGRNLLEVGLGGGFRSRLVHGFGFLRGRLAARAVGRCVVHRLCLGITLLRHVLCRAVGCDRGLARRLNVGLQRRLVAAPRAGVGAGDHRLGGHDRRRRAGRTTRGTAPARRRGRLGGVRSGRCGNFVVEHCALLTRQGYAAGVATEVAKPEDWTRHRTTPAVVAVAVEWAGDIELSPRLCRIE